MGTRTRGSARRKMSRSGPAWPPAALADEQPDSLEGWVPVREDLFAAPERHQLRFLVAWNDAEGKFAVTCHDRTAQRRRREGSRPGQQPEPQPAPGAAAPAPAPSWAGLLSAAGLRGAHRQLAALWPPLERCFPPLPPGLEAAGGAWGLGRGLWALLWPAPAGPGEAALQELCAQLERYLREAAGGCGGAAVRAALFPADGAEVDCESPRAFRERALRARCAEAGARLRQVRRVPAAGRPGGGAGKRRFPVGPGQGARGRGGAGAQGPSPIPGGGTRKGRLPVGPGEGAQGVRGRGGAGPVPGEGATPGRTGERGTGVQGTSPAGRRGRPGARADRVKAAAGRALHLCTDDAGPAGCGDGKCQKVSKAKLEMSLLRREE